MASSSGFQVKSRIRNLVSKEKRRFKNEKYDLDLTYITDRVIAMGFPSSDFEASYRNDQAEVYAFFEERHKDHYKFYNLCSERAYPPERYHGRVAHFPFDDHNPCPLGMFLFFCKDVDEYLRADDQNVVAIHCKAGKGRTGVMITAYLLWCRTYETPEDAMAFYGYARTNNQEGVTIPSQRTFINYWGKILDAADHFEGENRRDRSASSLIFTGDAAQQAQIRADISSMSEYDYEDDSLSEGELTDDDMEKGQSGSVALCNNLPPHPDATVSNDRHPPQPNNNGGRAVHGSYRQRDSMVPFQNKRASIMGKVIQGVSNLVVSGVPKRTTLASAATPKSVDPLMDRSWNDRNREERECRGTIPTADLKCIHRLRMITTPIGGYEPSFEIFTGGVRYDSRDMIPAVTYYDEVMIDIPVPDLAVIDEVLVIFYRRGFQNSRKKMLKFWFHTAFVEDDVVSVPKRSMDIAVKDCARNKKFSEYFKIEICLKPAPEGTSDPRKAKTATPKYFNLQSEHERNAGMPSDKTFDVLQSSSTPQDLPRPRKTIIVEGTVAFSNMITNEVEKDNALSGGIHRSARSRSLQSRIFGGSQLDTWTTNWGEFSSSGDCNTLTFFEHRGQSQPGNAFVRDLSRRAMLRVPKSDASELESRWAVIEYPIQKKDRFSDTGVASGGGCWVHFQVLLGLNEALRWLDSLNVDDPGARGNGTGIYSSRDIILDGWLVKRGLRKGEEAFSSDPTASNKFTTSRKRWFVMTPFHLVYFADDKCCHYKGSIELAGCEVNELEGSFLEFVVKTKSKDYYLEAPDTKKRDAWTQMLRQSFGVLAASPICRICGNTFMPDSRFCRKCGRARTTNSAPANFSTQASE